MSRNVGPDLTAKPVLSQRRVRLRIKEDFAEALALVGGAVVWELSGRLLGLSWFPPFSRIIMAATELIASGVIIGNLLVSLQTLVIGFGAAVVGGILIGLLMARYRLVEHALDMYVNAMLFAPSIIFAPLFFAIWGLSDLSRIAVVVKYSLFIIVVNTFTAIRTVDPALVEMAKSFGARRSQLFFRILLPASLPLVFAGLRLGMGRAVFGMINGEMFIAYVGLGALAAKYGGQFDATKVFAVSLVILCVALIAGSLMQAAERKFTYWAN